jgi:hypothetical protein
VLSITVRSSQHTGLHEYPIRGWLEAKMEGKGREALLVSPNPACFRPENKGLSIGTELFATFAASFWIQAHLQTSSLNTRFSERHDVMWYR